MCQSLVISRTDLKWWRRATRPASSALDRVSTDSLPRSTQHCEQLRLPPTRRASRPWSPTDRRRRPAAASPCRRGARRWHARCGPGRRSARPRHRSPRFPGAHVDGACNSACSNPASVRQAGPRLGNRSGHRSLQESGATRSRWSGHRAQARCGSSRRLTAPPGSISPMRGSKIDEGQVAILGVLPPEIRRVSNALECALRGRRWLGLPSQS